MLSWIQSHPAFSANRLAPIVVLAAFIVTAAAAGVVIASGNLILIGLAVGSILGVVLLNAIGVAVWIILVGTLLVIGPLVMHFPQLGRIAWLFSILGFFLLAASVLYEGTNRDPHRPAVPAFVVLGVLFGVYSTGMLVVSDTDLSMGISSVKRYFQFWGLMFILATVAFDASVVRRWLIFILGLAVIQLPFAVYQRIVLMPLRVNMPDSVVPVDIVTGTFEGSITGGANSNVMAYFLVGIIGALLCAHRESVLRRSLFWVLLVLVSAPLALGETKLVVVLLPVVLLVIYADLIWKRPFAFAAGAVAAAAAIGALGYSYVALQVTEGRQDMTFEQRLDENLDYNFGSRGHFGAGSLNRGNVVQFWWQEHGGKDPAATVFGHGLGASFGAVGADQLGKMDRRYPGYAIGLTSIAALLWDVGLFGTGLYLMMFVAAFITAGRMAARASPGLDRAMCKALQASLAMIPAMLAALDLHLMTPSLQVLTALNLGLIAWRSRLGHPTR